LPGLAADLRWTASQFVASLWQRLDPEIWSRTQNPLLILRHAPAERFEQLALDLEFMAELKAWLERKQQFSARDSWFTQQHADRLGTVAYFSMEFMLGEALPIYSGGLGNVAGDQLKSASDLGVPVVGVGLLYQQGYFRQTIGLDGAQRDAFPFNDPHELQVTPTTP
jgi:starch phosphorylase